MTQRRATIIRIMGMLCVVAAIGAFIALGIAVEDLHKDVVAAHGLSHGTDEQKAMFYQLENKEYNVAKYGALPCGLLCGIGLVCLIASARMDRKQANA